MDEMKKDVFEQNINDKEMKDVSGGLECPADPLHGDVDVPTCKNNTLFGDADVPTCKNNTLFGDVNVPTCKNNSLRA